MDIMPYVKKLLHKWKFLLYSCLTAAVVGVCLVIDWPKSYTATAVLAPEVTPRTTSMSALSSMAGLNSIARTEAMYPELYPEVISSMPFRVSLFSLPVKFKRHKEVIETDLYTYLRDYGKTPWWEKVTTAPAKALGWAIGLLKPKKEEAEEVSGYENIDPTNLTREQEKVAKILAGKLHMDVEKKTFMITVSVSMQDPMIAKVVCDEVIGRLIEFVGSYRTEKARKDVIYYQVLNDEAREEYYRKQQKYASYVDRNQGIALQSNRIEQERLQNETQLAFTLYNQTAQQLQSAKAKVQQERPVCAVIQPPVVPHRGAPSKIKYILTTVFLGFCAAAVWVLWGDKAKEIVTEIFKNEEE